MIRTHGVVGPPGNRGLKSLLDMERRIKAELRKRGYPDNYREIFMLVKPPGEDGGIPESIMVLAVALSNIEWVTHALKSGKTDEAVFQTLEAVRAVEHVAAELLIHERRSKGAQAAGKAKRRKRAQRDAEDAPKYQQRIDSLCKDGYNYSAASEIVAGEFRRKDGDDRRHHVKRVRELTTNPTKRTLAKRPSPKKDAR